MRSERDIEAPLTPEDVQKILSICSPRGLLVGGQALAFWADHLRVERPANLVSGVTADADFIGDSRLAKDLGKRLGWQTWIPALDDSTPQTGKVTHRTKTGGVNQREPQEYQGPFISDANEIVTGIPSAAILGARKSCSQ